MEWIDRLKKGGRAAALVLLVVAVVGPWAYTLDGVPPPEYCREPNFLLSSGYCAGLTSGAELIFIFIPGFFYLVAGVFTGEVVFPERGREFFGIFVLALLALALLLPLLTTLFRMAGRNSRRWRIFHLTAWGAAGVVSLLPVALDAELRSGRYWGIYLYLALAVGMVVLEAVGPRRAAASQAG